MIGDALDSKGKFPMFPSGLRDNTSISRNAKDIESIFFAGVTPHVAGKFQVYQDDTVGSMFLKQLAVYDDANGNGKHDPSEEIYSLYTLRVFVSRDTSILEKAFEKHQPDADELCIYLEDNTGDAVSGTTAQSAYKGMEMIVVGKDVRDQLEDFFKKSNKEDGYLALKNIAEDLGVSIDYSRKELKRLIEKGKTKTTAQSIGIGIFQFLNGIHIFAAPAYRALGNFITSTTQKIREYTIFQGYHWDPEVKRPDGEIFSPALLPVSYETLAEYSDEGFSASGKVASKIQASLKSWYGSNGSGFRKLLKKKSLPEPARKFFLSCEKGLEQSAAWIMKSMNQVMEWASWVGTKWVNFINAFYCGLWNGLVEAVLGLVDLVGYVFLGLAAFGKAAGEAHELIPKIQEKLDEIIQAILSTDLGAWYTQMMEFLFSGVASFNPWALTQWVSIEKVAYFLGQIVGFIVETAVSIFYSGGSAGLIAATRKIGSVCGALGETMVKVLKKGIEAVFGIIKASADSLLRILNQLVEFIKGGPQQMKKVFRWFTDELEKAAKLPADLMNQVIKKFGFSKSELDSLKDMGLTITNISEDACKACQIRV